MAYDGVGDSADLLSAMDAVLKRPNKYRPAIINYSITMEPSIPASAMVQKLINSGVLFIGAAGNDPTIDTCDVFQGHHLVVSVSSTADNDSVSDFSAQGKYVTHAHLFILFI